MTYIEAFIWLPSSEITLRYDMYKGLMFQNQLLTSRLCRWIYRGIHVHHLVLIKSQFNSICISSNLFQVCWIKASSYWMGQPLSIDVVYIWAIVSHNPHNRIRRNEKVQVTKGMSFTKVWLQISVTRWQVKFVQLQQWKFAPTGYIFSVAKEGKNVVECQINSFKLPKTFKMLPKWENFTEFRVTLLRTIDTRDKNAVQMFTTFWNMRRSPWCLTLSVEHLICVKICY